ncbi:MAG: hypothetical protein JNJ78_02700 [Anaerolineae bacterium]|nr:hypothetical protein [Anaerolineae bacterium]
MGIRLDWEVEAEKTHTQRVGEDPNSTRRRRAARFRFLLFLLFLLVILGGVVFFIINRLQALDDEVKQELTQTVEAEIAALRLGDLSAFIAIQRSASSDWAQEQQQVFYQYQDLKLQDNVELTGRVTDVALDRTRARVGIEEIIGGIPYTRIWFYWRYDDGWRHVPPDYTFWGDVSTEEQPNVIVRYRDVDHQLAKALSERVSNWLTVSCAALACPLTPVVSIEVIPDDSLQVGWLSPENWQLQIPSPYVNRARSDQPFDTDLQFAVSSLLAERLVAFVNNVQPIYPSDAYYLRQSVVSWLVGRFVQVNTNTFLMNSLADSFGDAAVGRLLTAMQPDSSITVLGQVTGQSLEQLNLDWRDFLTWKLSLEFELINRRDEGNFLALYDTRDENARNSAYQRFNANSPAEAVVVNSVQRDSMPDGSVILRALAAYGVSGNNTQAEVIFQIADGVWKRLN